eukprot:scaffold108519_cov78-Phaeocystis_antarctica.AAC.9
MGVRAPRHSTNPLSPCHPAPLSSCCGQGFTGLGGSGERSVLYPGRIHARRHVYTYRAHAI